MPKDQWKSAVKRKPKRKPRKARKLIRNDPAWQERLAEAGRLELDARELAKENGLFLNVTWVQAGRTTFPHWACYDHDGRQILRYWPTTRKAMSSIDTDEKWTNVGPLDSILLAVGLSRRLRA